MCAAIQFELVEEASAIERGHFDGHHHFGTEFLRLHIGASGERLAGDASGGTEVIFDSRASVVRRN